MKVGKQMRKKNRQIIEYKPGVNKAFNIGHSLSVSETFFPDFQENPNEKGSYFVDIAGNDDTDGFFIELIIMLINKKIFSWAKEIKILVLFPKDKIFESRGT